MDTLQNTLYHLSSALLFPVVILLLVLAAWTVVMFGGFVREALARSTVRRSINSALIAIRSQPQKSDEALKELKNCTSGIPVRFLAGIDQWPTESLVRDKLLEDAENNIGAILSRMTFIIRIGPMLGLMGTLIPLGPALTGLASGNIATLSSNLVVAFTTTVVGVFIGSAAFTMSLVRRTWYDRDLSDLEFIVRMATDPKETRDAAKKA